MPFITTSDDVKLHYLDEGDGPAVLLVGGYGMAASGWQLQREALTATHRVITVDRRSHGDSDHVLHGNRMARHAADLSEALAAIGVDDVVAMGASMGASALWSYVDLFGTARLRAIVSVDQTPKMVNEGPWHSGMYGLEPDGVEEFVTDFPGAHNPFHRMPPVEVLALLRGGQTPPYDDLRPLLRDHVWADWRDVVGRIDIPVLAVAGRHSPLWPCEHAEHIAATAQHGQAVVLDDSGHVPFLEQPQEFNAALLTFLGGLG